jgi:hypothetical protein
MSDNTEKTNITLEDVYNVLLEVQITNIANQDRLAMFEAKLATLEEKLPGALDSVMSNPLLKPFLKMVSK